MFKPFTGFDAFKSSANTPTVFSQPTTTGAPATTPFFSFNSSSNKPFGTSAFGSGDGSSGIFGSAAPAASGGGEGEGDEEPYEPPKPESSDFKEEGSVLTKRVKLFYYNEKEKKYTDRGIGNLFIKPIDDAAKAAQLIIRADNTLGTILLNVKLNKMFPVAKEGKNNVSYLCVPNPPIPNVNETAPCKFLFKVKTDEDATELHDKLNEYKK